MKFLAVFVCVFVAASASHLAPVVHVDPIYAGPQHLPVIGANGVPVDTAEIQHARAAHLSHKVEAHARNGDYAVAAVAPVAYAAHHAVAAAPFVATTHHHAVAAPVVSTYAAPYAYHGHGYHHAYPNSAVHATSVSGVPLETPEVVAAKAHHFAAHAEALARSSPIHHYRKRRQVFAATPFAYSAYGGYSYPTHSAYSYSAYPYVYGY